MNAYEEFIAQAAASQGYSRAAFDAGREAYRRKNRLINPPGKFDKAGRFYAAERTPSVCSVRQPSRRFPYPEMNAARTAAHCANLFDVEPLHAKRVCKALEVVEDSMANASAHKRMELMTMVMGILKPIKPSKKVS